MDLLKLFEGGFSSHDLMTSVVNISNFHRIQGSIEMERAARYIYNILKELVSFDSKIMNFPYTTPYGTLNPVVGWWVKDAELWTVRPNEKLLHSFRKSKTLVVAHSPGGEVTAEVVHINCGDRSRCYGDVDVSGKAVLTSGNAFLTYREACRRGASVVLLYRDDAPYDAVPYMSLFLTPDDVRWAKSLALSVSRRTAHDIIQHLKNGDKVVVRAYVDAGYTDGQQINVVSARLGDNPTEIHIFAHYCHPRGTVNDNVSGAATLLELAKVLDELIRRGKLSQPKKHSIVLLWYPEYYGPTAYLPGKEGVVFGVNLDMIGERQEVTNSTLNYVRPPPSLFHPYEALFYYELRRAISEASFTSPKKSVSLRFDTLPYEVGSDHDVYILLGVPAVMINQWPDTYYHTDLDTVDKFNPKIAILIGSAVGSAAYKASTEGIDKHLVISYVFEYLGSETSWVSDEVRAYRLKYLCRKLSDSMTKYLGNSLNLEKITLQDGGLTSDEDVTLDREFIYVGPPGILDLRAIVRQLSEAEVDELEVILRSGRYVKTILQCIIPLLLKRRKTVRELRNEIVGEVGVDIGVKELEKILNILVKVGLVIEIK
ncbi:MAG: DUF4910 domain-containing protein [Sulfolobales archaeon]